MCVCVCVGMCLAIWNCMWTQVYAAVIVWLWLFVCVCVHHYLQSEHLSVCINQQKPFLHHSRPEASMLRSDTRTTSCSLLPPSFFIPVLVRLLRSLLCWTRGRLFRLDCSRHPPFQDLMPYCFYFPSPVHQTHSHMLQQMLCPVNQCMLESASCYSYPGMSRLFQLACDHSPSTVAYISNLCMLLWGFSCTLVFLFSSVPCLSSSLLTWLTEPDKQTLPMKQVFQPQLHTCVYAFLLFLLSESACTFVSN